MRKLLFFKGIIWIHNLVSGQESVSHQLWGNAIFSFPKSKYIYLELDVEPKLQISGAEGWHNIDVTPLIEYYPNSWIDLTGEITVGPGYRLTYATRFEMLFIYDFARDTLYEAVDRDAIMLDLRFKFFF